MTDKALTAVPVEIEDIPVEGRSVFIRRLVIADREISAEDIVERLKAANFAHINKSTVQSLRYEVRTTLSLMEEAGWTAPGAEPQVTRPKVARQVSPPEVKRPVSPPVEVPAPTAPIKLTPKPQVAPPQANGYMPLEEWEVTADTALRTLQFVSTLAADTGVSVTDVMDIVLRTMGFVMNKRVK